MIDIRVLSISSLLLAFLSAPSFADGKSDYDTKCSACHGFGVAGAPKLTDTDGWKIRLEKGIDAVYQNAIEGFQGDVGYMPAKGGFNNLSDEAVRAVVDYMIQQTATD